MKAIMIAIKPKYCELIMNGEKTIEVRKNKALATAIQKLIDKYGYADIYVYCSKDKSLIYTDGIDGKGDYVDYKYYESYKGDKNDIGSGKVLFKFRCCALTEIKPKRPALSGLPITNYNVNKNVIMQLSCLSSCELDNYLKGDAGYAIHIGNLEIFDKPKELREFYNIVPSKLPLTRDIKYLTKAPQNFCYVEVD